MTEHSRDHQTVLRDAIVLQIVPVEKIWIFEGNQTNLGGAEFYHGDELVFAVPEPMSLTLIGIAGVTLLRRRGR